MPWPFTSKKPRVAFVYIPLQRPNHSIRLLRIDKPPKRGISLKCTLIDSAQLVSAGKALEYTALSYTWDQPFSTAQSKDDYDEDDIIYLRNPGCPYAFFTIGKNLEEALLAIAAGFFRSTRHRPAAQNLLWIDAICINQQNAPEKASQIIRMGSIYSQSSEVLSWMGQINRLQSFAMQMLVHTIPDMLAFTELNGPIGMGDFTVRRDGHISMRKHGIRPDGSLGEFQIEIDMAMLRALVEIMAQCRLFQRVWVIQEQVLAPKSVLVTQDDILTRVTVVAASAFWSQFYLPLAALASDHAELYRSDMEGHSVRDLGTMHFLAQIWHDRALCRALVHSVYGCDTQLPLDNAAVKDPMSLSPFYNLYEFFVTFVGYFSASRPHDRIYGILGLVNPLLPASTRTLFMPDYTKPIEQLLTEVTTTLLRHSKHLTTLSLVQGPLRQMNGLPSWVPTYGAPEDALGKTYNHNSPLFFEAFLDHAQGALHTQHCYNASGFQAPLRSTWTHRIAGTRLYVHGFRSSIISKISYQSRPMGVAEISKSDLAADGWIAFAVDARLNFGSTYFNGQSMGQALADTVGGLLLPHYFDARIRLAELHAILLLRGFGLIEGTRNQHRQEGFEQRYYDLMNPVAGYEGFPTPAEIRLVRKYNETCKRHGIDSREAQRERDNMLNDPKYVEIRRLAGDFMSRITGDRAFFRTREGYIGRALPGVEEDDEIWILYPAKVPFVLRRTATKSQYRLVGEAYVQGGMHGELLGRSPPEQGVDGPFSGIVIL